MIDVRDEAPGWRLRALRPAGDPVRLGAWRTAGSDAGPLPMPARPGARQFLFGSGTAALAAALIAARRRRGIPAGQGGQPPEVVVPAFACPDVVAAVCFAGAIPVVADTVAQSPSMDPRALARVLSSNTVAVVHVRFLGLPGNGRALRAEIGDADVCLIEDAAHVFPGADPDDGSADAIVHSFGRGKPMSLRTGGLLVMRGEWSAAVPAPAVTGNGVGARLRHRLVCDAYDLAISPRVHGVLVRWLGLRTDVIRWRELHALDSLPSHLLPLVVQRLRAGAPDRRALLDAWRAMLDETPGPWTDLGASIGPACRSLWRYPLLVDDEATRDRLFDACRRGGLGASRMYRRPLGALPGCDDRVRGGPTPNASSFASRLLALPMHDDVTPSDVDGVRRVLARFARTAGRPASPLATAARDVIAARTH